MMMHFAPAIAALSLMAAPAMAQSTRHDPTYGAPVDVAALATQNLTDGGEWTFRAPRGAPKGSPVCVESWTFRADGSMTVISGSQTVEKTWRAVEEDGFTKLYTTSLSSTTGTDCMGERADPTAYPQEESGGFAMLFFGNGTNAYLCNPVLMENPDGTKTPFYGDEDCWGELRSVPKPVTVDAPSPAADTTKPATPEGRLPVNY